jgi:hypothetical protein
MAMVLRPNVLPGLAALAVLVALAGWGNLRGMGKFYLLSAIKTPGMAGRFDRRMTVRQ